MSLKTTAISNLGLYVKKDPELPAMLEKIRSSGKTVFLLTNSDWWYTNNIMKFLLEDDNNSKLYNIYRYWSLKTVMEELLKIVIDYRDACLTQCHCLRRI